MKRTLTVLFLIVAALALVLAPAQAAGFELVTVYNGGTANIAAGATATPGTVLYVGSAKYVGISSSWKLGGTGSDNTIIRISKSADGSTWETTPSINITNANNGTTKVEYFTSATLEGASYLKIGSVVNGDSGDYMTNVVLRVGIKNE